MLQESSPGLHVSSQSEDVRHQGCSVGVAQVTHGLPEAGQALVHHWILEKVKANWVNAFNTIKQQDTSTKEMKMEQDKILKCINYTDHQQMSTRNDLLQH